MNPAPPVTRNLFTALCVSNVKFTATDSPILVSVKQLDFGQTTEQTRRSPYRANLWRACLRKTPRAQISTANSPRQRQIIRAASDCIVFAKSEQDVFPGMADMT